MAAGKKHINMILKKKSPTFILLFAGVIFRHSDHQKTEKIYARNKDE